MEIKLKDFIFSKQLLNPYQVSAIIRTYQDNTNWQQAKIIKNSKREEMLVFVHYIKMILKV